MTSTEMRGFVFSIVFIIVFAGLLASIPADLQGQGGTAETVLPVDPQLITDFSDDEDFTRTDFSAGVQVYDYDLGGFKWRCLYDGSQFSVYRKILIAGVLWLGATKSTQFYLDNGTNRGQFLSYTELEGDAEDGTVRYDLELTDSGNEAGGFVFYWNTTTHSDPEDAWDNDILYLLHGIGIDASATQNIGALLVSLLFLQLPNVPVLVNLLIATPIWACIVFVLWFVIKEMIPFA